MDDETNEWMDEKSFTKKDHDDVLYLMLLVTERGLGT
jgi:hypothetical protein